MKVAPIVEKLKRSLGIDMTVMRTDDTHMVKRVMGMNVDWIEKKKNTKKRLLDCVRNVMKKL